MKVLNQDTKQSFEISFQSWKTDLYPKKKFTVAEWGDLVMLRAIEQFGDRKDIEIMEREAAMKRIKNDPYKYDFRVATHQDLQSLRGKYLIADDYIEGLTFNELFEKYEQDSLFHLIKTVGLSKIATFTGLKASEIVKYRKCELCEKLFNSPENLKFLRNKADANQGWER